jgi:hypothetical protein
MRLLRPNDAAAPERLVSFKTWTLTKPRRRKDTLYQVSFLRGNAPIVRLLLKDMAQELRVSQESHLLPSAKRAKAEYDLDARFEVVLSTLLKTAWSSTLSKVKSSQDGDSDGEKDEVEVLSTVEKEEVFSEGGEAELTFDDLDEE